MSSLSSPMSGASTGWPRRGVDRAQVVERLRGDLAERVAGDEGARSLALEHGLAEPEHDPAVRHHARAGRDRGDQRRLDLGERDQVELAAELEPVEYPREVEDLVAHPLLVAGVVVEVEQDRAGAAPDEAIGGDRAVEAAGEQRDHRPGAAHRQPADSGLAVGVHQRVEMR